MGGARSRGLDGVVPSVALDQLGERAAVAVVRVLCGFGDEGDALFEEFVHRELGGLWSPAADGVAVNNSDHYGGGLDGVGGRGGGREKRRCA